MHFILHKLKEISIFYLPLQIIPKTARKEPAHVPPEPDKDKHLQRKEKRENTFYFFNFKIYEEKHFPNAVYARVTLRVRTKDCQRYSRGQI